MSDATTENPLSKRLPRVALLWHGDREARKNATLKEGRFSGVAEALYNLGIETEPAVYHDDFADEVRDQLSRVDGVLVWVNPIEKDCNRIILDTMLRQVAAEGVFVSAHPDTILKMGTKEVLVQTRGMSWGSDTHLYKTIEELREQLSFHLTENNPLVLKQYRGHSGNGIWKVERHPGNPLLLRVRHAVRGSAEQDMSLDEFLSQCESYFASAGHMVGQPYQDRITDGMVRCYLVGDKVAGFGHQLINALFPAPPGMPTSEAPQPGPRLYYAPTKPEFQAVKARMEDEWVGVLCHTLDMNTADLPLLWDADFLFGPKDASGEDTYVLCEINVSCVSPFPPEALGPLAQAVCETLGARGRGHS